MKFAFIAEQEVAFPVVVVCRVLEVSTSGFYAWRGNRQIRTLHRPAHNWVYDLAKAADKVFCFARERTTGAQCPVTRLS